MKGFIMFALLIAVVAICLLFSIDIGKDGIQ